MKETAPLASVVFFWDYDTQWGADRSRSPGTKDWGPLEFPNTDRLLELHAEYGVSACFAVVGSAALPGPRPYHDPEQIRRIHAAGHEVASHTHRHEWLPGLGPKALRESLRASKDALEQCIGSPVISFVPPYNRPYDYPAGLSFSLSERRGAKHSRTGLGCLCAMLYETGYRFTRVSYRPFPQRLIEVLMGRRVDYPSRLKTIAGVACLRQNTPNGFDGQVVRTLERFKSRKGFTVISAHPHSLTADNPQNERYLVPLLARVSQLCREGTLSVRLPRDLLNGSQGS